MALSVSGNDDGAYRVLADPLLKDIVDLVNAPPLFGHYEHKPWTRRQRWAWRLSPSTLRWKLAKRLYPEGFEDEAW